MKKMKYLIILSVVLISCKKSKEKSKVCTETTIDQKTNKELSNTTTYFVTPQQAKQFDGTVKNTYTKVPTGLPPTNGETSYAEKLIYVTTIKCN